MATASPPRGRHRHRHHRPTARDRDLARARARHHREWAAIAAEATLALLRKKRSHSSYPSQSPRRVRGRTTLDEPLLWALAHRYNSADAHAHGLRPALRLWESNELAMQLGTVYWGLRHILRRHRANFAAYGVGEGEVCELVRSHVRNGKPVFEDWRSRWYELGLGDGRPLTAGKGYLCVIYAAPGTGEGPCTVLSAYPATEKRLYMERRRNQDLQCVLEVDQVPGVSSPVVLGPEDTYKPVYPHGHTEKEPEIQKSRPGEVNDIPETAETSTTVPNPGVAETALEKLELTHDLATKPTPAIITPGSEPTTEIALETPLETPPPLLKRFKIKRIWHAFSTPQIRRLLLTNAEVDALPGTTHERSLRRRLGKSIHATVLAPPRNPPSIIIPSATAPETPVRALRIHRYPEIRHKEAEEEVRPSKLAHRVPVRPYAPVPRVHRTRAPPYRPRPRITKFVTRRKVVRSIRGRPFVRVDRSYKLRRPARARRRTRRARDRRGEGWSVTRGTPGDVLAVLETLVRSRAGKAAVDGRQVRAGVLGLLRERKAFLRSGSAVNVRRTGAFTAMRPMMATRQQHQVRPVHTYAGVCTPAAALHRRTVGLVRTSVLPALWRFAGRRMFL